MKRSLLLATVFGASGLVCFSAYAEPATHLVTDGTTTIRVRDDDQSTYAKVHAGGPTIRPTLRVGDPRLKAAREAAAARKIKSEQK